MDALANSIQILTLCKAKGLPVILGADAHISFDIADYSNALPLIEQTGFPEELIVN